MANELVTTGGGGAVVPASTGGEVGEHVGDVSLYRDAPAGADRAAGGAANSGFMQDLQRAVGFDIAPEQIKKAHEVMRQHRLAEDARQKTATVAALRHEWGLRGYDERTRRIVTWLGTLPGDLGEEILRARDAETGDAICSKPAVLRAMYEVAAATILVADDERDKAAAVRTLQAEWKGAYHSHVATIKRYLDTVPQSVREGLLSARDDNGVAVMNDPQVLKWLLHLARPRLEVPRGGPAPDLTAMGSARRRELEVWMEKRDPRYWKDEAAQREYRELLDQGVASDVLPKTADADVTDRIAQIEALMGKSNSEYYRGSNADALQRELRQLYNRREQHRR